MRHTNYTLPPEFLNFNAALFKLANVSYSPASATNSTGMIFNSFLTERAVWSDIGSNFFSPVRTPPHSICVSNFAISPQLRMTQMNEWSDLFPGDALQFRYDRLNQHLWEHFGSFTFELVQSVIQYLSPIQTPGYWVDYLVPAQPMSAQIQGILVAADLKHTLFAVKGGYWADGWCQVQLSKYTDPAV